MHRIVGASLRLRLVVVALAAGLICFGIVQMRTMPVDVLPEFTPPYVEIQTESLGLSAQEVEQLITVPLEQDLLNGLPWLQTIRSESVPGLSSIVLLFQPGTDLIRARQMVSERMTQAVALPHVSKPPTMLQPLSSSSRVLMVGLSSKDLSLIQMSVLARWTIAPRLMGVPGVANVAIWGQRDRQLQVQVDPKRLQEKNVSLLQVLETTANSLWVSSLSFVEASTPGTGGFIDTANQRLGIRHILPIVSGDSLAQVPIEETSLRLSDVANVVEDHQPLIGDALTNNGASIMLVIEKFPGASTFDVTRNIEQALEDMRPGLAGMQTDSSVFRPADFIQAMLDNLALTLLIGFVAMLLALVAFFFEWRTVLISLVTIPLAVVAAGLVLWMRGATINIVAILGLAVAAGVLIDDAIVDVEHVVRRLRAAPGEPAAAVIRAAVLEMRGPLAYALLIALLAIVPVFFVEGMLGTFLQPLALTYLLAVVAGMAVALLVTPGLCLLLLGRAPAALREAGLASRLARGYGRLLSRLLSAPRAAYLLAALLLVLGLVALPLLSPALTPSFKERNLLITLSGPPGTSQPEMSRIAGRVSQELRGIAGVSNVGAEVGRAVQGDQVVNVSSAQVWVSIDPRASYDSTAAAIQSVISGYPGIRHSVRTALRAESENLAGQASNALVVRVYGDTTDLLRLQAENVKQSLAGIAGIVGTRVTLPVQQPTLEINVDLAAAQRYGIKPGDVRRTAATMLSGLQVGNLFEEQKVFDVVVWSTPETRNSISNINDLQIDTPGGQRVRLGDVAKVRIVPAPSIIRHDAVKRYLDVVADVRGRSLGAVAAEIDSRIRQLQFPMEYHAEVLGDYAEQQAAQTRLLALAIAVAIGIFFVLQAAYGSWRLALLSFLTLPAALSGGLLATLAAGGALSIGALGGLLAVFGLAVRGQILLLGRYRRLIGREGRPFGADMVLEGARERLAPALATVVALGLALLATLFLGDVPGLELVRPLAVAVLGGLVTTAAINFFALPALYLSLRVTSVDELELPPLAGVAEQEIAGAAL
ncbi:efflux RND transporter permease subunit [Kouleothrix sp.]|uniref:efflux RND transporter permease subunit n=1 Tax=Kouleothrix sp. TaxID=2779161 RepID=UPI00391BF0BF